MSDKVTKIRINGVEKEVGGSDSGGVSGAYLAPKTLISPSYTGFEQATINPIALVEQLEKAGVSVDEPVMDSGENNVTLNIGYTHSESTTGKPPMIYLTITYYLSNSSYSVAVSLMGTSLISGTIYGEQTLRSIINHVFTEIAPDLHFSLDTENGYLENFINIRYAIAAETLHYYISNMTEFCEEVVIEYNPGSDSGSAPSDNTAK